MTLPKLVLSPRLDFTYDRSLTSAVNLGIGLALGATDDLSFDTHVNVPLQSASLPAIHEFTAGATYRFLNLDLVELGGRLEFGAFTVDSGVPDDAVLRMTAMVPFKLHAGKIFRLDAGVAITGLFPVDGSTEADGALATYGSDPNIVGPGIPIQATIQIIEPLFAGLDTGFGMLTFREDFADDGCFAPLGLRFGGTIPMDDRPLADVVGNFTFPYFLLGADPEPPATEVWQVGVSVRAYAPL